MSILASLHADDMNVQVVINTVRNYPSSIRRLENRHKAKEEGRNVLYSLSSTGSFIPHCIQLPGAAEYLREGQGSGSCAMNGPDNTS